MILLCFFDNFSVRPLATGEGMVIVVVDIDYYVLIG